VLRYERQRPGELLHLDIKQLGRFDRVGHRITGDRTGQSNSRGVVPKKCPPAGLGHGVEAEPRLIHRGQRQPGGSPPQFREIMTTHRSDRRGPTGTP
jgi:hypothetical protein